LMASGARTLEELLSSLSLEKFIPKFKEEEIDLDAARMLSDEDLKELGLPLGPRKKLREAFHSTAEAAPAAAAAPKHHGPAPSKALKDPGLFQWQFSGECASYGDDRPAAIMRAWHPTGEPASGSFRNQFITVSTNGIMSWHLETGQSQWKIKSPVLMQGIDVDTVNNVLVAAGGNRSTSLIEVYDLSNNRLKGSLDKPGGLSEGFNDVCLLTHSGSPQAVVPDYNSVTRKLHIFDLETSKKVTSVETDIRGHPRLIQDPFNPGVFFAAPFMTDNAAGGKISIFDARAKPVTSVRSLLGLKTSLVGLNIAPTIHSSTGIVCGTSESEVKLFDLRTDNCLATIPAGKGHAFSGGEINQSAVGVMRGHTFLAYDIAKVCSGDVSEPECEIMHNFCQRCSPSSRWVSVLAGHVVIQPMEYLAIGKWAK